MLTTLAIAHYRSLRDLVVPLARLNLVTGPNGSGKSSLYRALRLLADTAQGRVVPTLAKEGGLASTLWAGPETIARSVRRGEHAVQGTTRKGPVSLRLGFAGDPFGYLIDLGLPEPSRSAFLLDPVIKHECAWSGATARPAALLAERIGGVVKIRGEGSDWAVVTQHLRSFDSMTTHCADPRTAPELATLREQVRAWRFYDHFRTDADAPARQARIGTHTPVMSDDGADLAAALQTIREIGDGEALDGAIEDAFPGSRVEVAAEGARFEVLMHQHGLLRPLRAAELSDGTLRYLLLSAALLTPRPPPLLVLNEPETSLHPDLLPALGRLIAQAAQHSQVVVVSHAARLIATLRGVPEANVIELEKDHGETRVAGLSDLERPPWHWPGRK